MFFKLEAIFNRVMFKSLEEDKSINLSKNTVDLSISVSLDSINRESYRNVQISDIYKRLNVGHLLPITCGHNGIFNDAELEAYQNHLLNSNITSV